MTEAAREARAGRARGQAYRLVVTLAVLAIAAHAHHSDPLACGVAIGAVTSYWLPARGRIDANP